MEIKNVVPVILVLGGLALGYSQVFAQDTNYARDLYNHNLKAKATETFIEILHNPKSSSNEKAEALYYLGQISFEEFEKSFPSSSSLQGFRYQIAQAYWGKKDFGNAKKWLQKIIEAGGEQETFYTKTAKARMQKLEW